MENMNMPHEGGEFYLNPWSKINKLYPQIIKFKSNGDVIKQNVPARHFINFRKLTRSMRKKNMNDYLRIEDPYLWNSTTVLSEIHGLINAMYATGTHSPRDKLKILTYCDENRSVCRFLSCPYIKHHCTLCEVIMNEKQSNSTQCEKISTEFLFPKLSMDEPSKYLLKK